MNNNGNGEMALKETVWSTTWTTFGKWILTGEHAVLRGAPALVFPLREKKMEFYYEKFAADFNVEFRGSSGEEVKLIFWGLLEEALKRLSLKREQLSGKLTINSDLPLGAGLGASAALCVGVSRLFKNLNFIQEDDLFEFSRGLENLFHGESSGVDIAVALTGEPLKFYRFEGRKPLSIRWKPHFYVSFSGQRGITSECVAKVSAMHKSDKVNALELDQQMMLASDMCEKALQTPSPEGFLALKKGIEKASQVFSDWGLIDAATANHMDALKALGAVAVKPTGSGGGGYVLSLWNNEPPKENSLNLIRA